MTMMDERLAQRRRGVSEDRARRRLWWVIVAIVVVLLVAAGAWLIRSPVLSIGSVTITGAQTSNPAAVVEALGMGVGTPTIDVRASEIEQGIEADPWVADAIVRVGWPGSLTISVTEHVPVAIAETADGLVLMALDGSAIGPPADASTLPTIEVTDRVFVRGVTSDDPAVLGALAFVAALSEDRRSDVVVVVDDDGLAAFLDGHAVRLGRPTDLALKAAVLEELLEEGLATGAAIDLIAPTRPAVRNPQPQQEAEE